jgi:predicted adenine nucleotide alpha hydrolase (AANH) superfamily ATPase
MAHFSPRLHLHLFRRQWFSEFQTADFFGNDELLLVIKKSKSDQFLHSKIIPVKDRRAPISQKVFDLMIEEFKDRLPPDASFHTFLASDPSLSHLKLPNKALTILTSDATNLDFESSKLKAYEFFKAQCFLEHNLFPEFNWQSKKAEDHFNFFSHPNREQFYDFTHPALHNEYLEHTRKKKMLVHVCCGPDVAGLIEQLKNDFNLICFWYDPNIHPLEEHEKRKNAFIKVAQKENIPYILGEYDPQYFLSQIKQYENSPEQGAKCSLCYDLRLERSAHEAQKQNCDFFTSSLCISPHKVQLKLKNFGEKSAKKYGVSYYYKNFMKDDGFKGSVEYSKQYEIYRQDYCGCWFSLHEGGSQAQAWAKELHLTKKDLDSGNYTIPNISQPQLKEIFT